MLTRQKSVALFHRLAGQNCFKHPNASAVASLSTWLWASSGQVHSSADRFCSPGHSAHQAFTKPSIGLRSFQTSSVGLAKDYYDILGVPKTSSQADLKKAYYKLAKQYHPDTNKGNKEAEAKFQEVSKAYDTLRDPETRSVYDQVGPEGMEAGASAGGGGNPFAGFGFNVNDQAIDPQDLFNMLFGQQGAGGRGRAQGGFGGFHFYEDPVAAGKVGHDIHTRIRVSFEEAAKGGSKAFTLNTRQGPQKIDMHIPAGARSNETFQIDGKGSPAKKKDGRPGNLLVTLDVQRHPVFKQHNFDIHMDKSVDLADALLGSTLRIPTLDGEVEIKLKAGTQHNDTLRLGGKGIRMEMAGMPNHRGDHIVHVNVVIPRYLSPRQREIVEEFKQEEQTKTASQKKAQAA